MAEKKDRIRAHLVIRGLVQGVWFRASTVEQAHQAKVGGWVCNRPDGAVEVVIEGERSRVMQLVAWCYRGPRSARVESVDLKWEEPTGEFSGFTVSY